MNNGNDHYHPSARGRGPPPCYVRGMPPPPWSQAAAGRGPPFPPPPPPHHPHHHQAMHEDPRNYNYPQPQHHRPLPPPSSWPTTKNCGGGWGGYERRDFIRSGGGGGYGDRNRHRPRPPVPDRHASSSGGGGCGGASRRRSDDEPGPVRKRAAKRRARHDLPGPVGAWLRRQKRGSAKSNGTAAAAPNGKLGRKVDAPATSPSKDGARPLDLDVPSNAAIAAGGGRDEHERRRSGQTTTERVTPEADPDPDPDDDHHPDGVPSSTVKRQERLFHDYSSDLHECRTWSLMCLALDRVVPPPNLLLSSSSHRNASSAYGRMLRRNLPEEYATIGEIHEGRHDSCDLRPFPRESDLRVPPLVGYVASVQCHAHSDWTAILVDEMHSVSSGGGGAKSDRDGGVRGGGGNGGGSGRGILCWIEERLAKRHPSWIRPGAVWMLEGARLALFDAAGDDGSDGDDGSGDEGDEGGANRHGLDEAAATVVAGLPPDVSPSTDVARGGGRIRRMLLVGESSMAYAWTPEEASSALTDGEVVRLRERRLNVALPEEQADDGGGADDSRGDAASAKSPEPAPGGRPPGSRNAGPNSEDAVGGEDPGGAPSPDGRGAAVPNDRTDDETAEDPRRRSEATDDEDKQAEGSSSEAVSAGTVPARRPSRRGGTPERVRGDDRIAKPRGAAAGSLGTSNAAPTPRNERAEATDDDLLGLFRTADDAAPPAGKDDSDEAGGRGPEKAPRPSCEESVSLSNPYAKREHSKPDGASVSDERKFGGPADPLLGHSNVKIAERTRQPSCEDSISLSNPYAKRKYAKRDGASVSDEQKFGETVDSFLGHSNVKITERTPQPLCENSISLSNPYAKRKDSKRDGASVSDEQKVGGTVDSLSGHSNVKIASPWEERANDSVYSGAADDDDPLGLLRSPVENEAPTGGTTADRFAADRAGKNAARSSRTEAAAASPSEGRKRDGAGSGPENDGAEKGDARLAKGGDSFDVIEEARAGDAARGAPEAGSGERNARPRIDADDSFDDTLDEDEEDAMLRAGAGAADDAGRDWITNSGEGVSSGPDFRAARQEAGVGETSYHTPKDGNYKRNAELLTGTGDSFDDMLDEDEEGVACAAAGTTNDAVHGSAVTNLGGVYSSRSGISAAKAVPPPDRDLEAYENPPEEPTAGAICYSTPKDGSNERNAELRIGTGDSFDDMLDEDEEDMARAATSSANGAVEKWIAAKLGDKKSCGPGTLSAARTTSAARASDMPQPGGDANTFTTTKPPVKTLSPSAFDSLDGDDLDFLGED